MLAAWPKRPAPQRSALLSRMPDAHRAIRSGGSCQPSFCSAQEPQRPRRVGGRPRAPSETSAAIRSRAPAYLSVAAIAATRPRARTKRRVAASGGAAPPSAFRRCRPAGHRQNRGRGGETAKHGERPMVDAKGGAISGPQALGGGHVTSGELGPPLPVLHPGSTLAQAFSTLLYPSMRGGLRRPLSGVLPRSAAVAPPSPDSASAQWPLARSTTPPSPSAELPRRCSLVHFRR